MTRHHSQRIRRANILRFGHLAQLRVQFRPNKPFLNRQRRGTGPNLRRALRFAVVIGLRWIGHRHVQNLLFWGRCFRRRFFEGPRCHRRQQPLGYAIDPALIRCSYFNRCSVRRVLSLGRRTGCRAGKARLQNLSGLAVHVRKRLCLRCFGGFNRCRGCIWRILRRFREGIEMMRPKPAAGGHSPAGGCAAKRRRCECAGGCRHDLRRAEIAAGAQRIRLVL